jgi:hypothetical protein
MHADKTPLTSAACLPGGLTPRNGYDRFCHECLAITKHSDATAPRASCTDCGTAYNAQMPATPHGAYLCELAQTEIKAMLKAMPPVRHGYLIPSGGALGVDMPDELRVVPVYHRSYSTND